MSDGQAILKTSLLDLLYELRDEDSPLILGGGYGLYLKQVYRQAASDTPTVIEGEFWPAPRATEDLDILLRTEVVMDAARMGSIRAALDRLNYTAVPGAEYMQFVKQLEGGRFVKIDLLTGPLGPLADDPRVKVDARRVRPRRSVKLHAHRTEEALGFQDNTMRIAVDGLLSSGEPYEAMVLVPSAFTLLLMKLYAFRDRCEDEEKDLARHHALDLYRVVAMMSEQEFGQTLRQIAQQQNHPVLAEAGRIVAEHFDSPESLGLLRLRSHSLWDEGMALQEFLSAMQDLFVESRA
ncbi:MAG TPA: hypothetical protein VM389_08980 [Phycisphaerae bacterium]|nr:hypothetical protein [Phycisphaerae bacterium]